MCQIYNLNIMSSSYRFLTRLKFLESSACVVVEEERAMSCNETPNPVPNELNRTSIMTCLNLSDPHFPRKKDAERNDFALSKIRL